jgi:hypothetical protein
VQSSWVLHRGGMTRGAYLPDTDHAALFKRLRGVSLATWKATVLRPCHPAVVEAGQQVLFPTAGAPP